MVEVLNNNLIVIPKYINRLKDMICYFWQPSMGNYDYRYKNRSSQQDQKKKQQKKKIDKQKQLNLDNITVLRIGENDKYMISVLNEENERILLTNGQPETSIIEECVEENKEIERTSIKKYMPSDYIDLYNKALKAKEYDICLTMLKGIEKHINTVYKKCKSEVKQLKLTKK